MNTFDVLQEADVKEQMEKLHEAVTAYIDKIRDTVNQAGELDKDKNKDSDHIDIDKILKDLGSIKEKLIDAISSKQASNYVLHALNAVYNFEAFLNPIASVIVTYGVRQLYVNKIGLEIITNINNIIKCICMDMIARSKSNRSLAELSHDARDYNMGIKDVMAITQKYIDARDQQVMQMLDQNIKSDADGFQENIKSADELINAFSQNDKWIAAYGMTTKAIAIQSANNLSLKIRKDMGSYITALSTCLDRRVVDNITFNKEGNFYNEDDIDDLMTENERKLEARFRDAKQERNDSAELIKEGKSMSFKYKHSSYDELEKIDTHDKEALRAYWNSNPSEAPYAYRYYYDINRLITVLKSLIGNAEDDPHAFIRVMDNTNLKKTNNYEKYVIINKKDFYRQIGQEDLIRTLEDHYNVKFSDGLKRIIEINTARVESKSTVNIKDLNNTYCEELWVNICPRLRKLLNQLIIGKKFGRL